jgi:hypothetical protein
MPFTLVVGNRHVRVAAHCKRAVNLGFGLRADKPKSETCQPTCPLWVSGGRDSDQSTPSALCRDDLAALIGLVRFVREAEGALCPAFIEFTGARPDRLCHLDIPDSWAPMP